jgi:hypothetical protein
VEDVDPLHFGLVHVVVNDESTQSAGEGLHASPDGVLARVLAPLGVLLVVPPVVLVSVGVVLVLVRAASLLLALPVFLLSQRLAL